MIKTIIYTANSPKGECFSTEQNVFIYTSYSKLLFRGLLSIDFESSRLDFYLAFVLQLESSRESSRKAENEVEGLL